jgi:chitobiase/beta-hexosaminidase-like protein
MRAQKNARAGADSWSVKRTSLLAVLLCAACAAVAGDSSGAASSYPSPLVLRSTPSSVTGSWKLDTTTAAGTATTLNVSTDGATDNGWYVFAPGTQSFTRLASLPTVPDGTGWIVDPGTPSGFPTGPWTFTVDTIVPGTTLDPGNALLTVGMWKGTVSGGLFSPTATLIPPTDDPSAQNLRASLTGTTSVMFMVPKFALGAGETLFVELWRHQVDGISDATPANRALALVVDDGSSAILHPAADDTGPTHAITVHGVSGHAAFDSTTNTLYYKGDAAGSLTVDDSITDSGSGPLQVTYPFISAPGWAHTAETVFTGPTYTSSLYSWTSAATTSPGAQSIVAEDNARQTSTGTLTLTNDTTGPTGQSAALNGGPHFSTASVPLTLTTGSDAGAGLDSASGVVERASAPATSGTCGTFGSWAPVTLTSGADASVTSGNCYRYRYTVSDVLGNAATPSAASADALVDTTAPTVAAAAPTELTGADAQFFAAGTLWFRPGAPGSFKLAATPADPESGVASVAFPDLSTTTGWTGSTGGTATAAPYTSPTTYSWTTGATAPGAKTMTVTNGTGLTGTGTVTISADTTAPSGQTIALTGGPWYTTTSVPLTITRGTDTGSGVDAARDVVQRASAPLASGSCGTFGAFSAVTLVGGADTSVSSGNCYRYELEVTDNVGNVSAASPASADAKVDTTPPTTPSLLFTAFSNAAATGSTVFYRPSAAGSFTVTAGSADAESGAPTYTFPSVAGFTLTGAGASRTFAFTSAVSAPLAPLKVTATNPNGLVSTAASFTLVPDPTPPTVTVLCNAKPCATTAYTGPVTISMSGSDGTGSGLASISYTTTGADPTPDTGVQYTTPFAVSSLTNLKVVAFDKAGNASAVTAITVRSLADSLVLAAPLRVTVRPAGRYLRARVSSTQRARMVATMTGRGLGLHRWRFTIARGASIVQLRLPLHIRRPGTYTVRWNAAYGTKRAAKLTRVTLSR